MGDMEAGNQYPKMLYKEKPGSEEKLSEVPVTTATVQSEGVEKLLRLDGYVTADELYRRSTNKRLIRWNKFKQHLASDWRYWVALLIPALVSILIAAIFRDH